MRKSLIVAITALLSACAGVPTVESPQFVLEGANGAYVRLYAETCSQPGLLERVKAEHRASFKRATSMFNVQRSDGSSQLTSFTGCWAEVPKELSAGANLYIVLFDDGDVRLFDKSDFKGAQQGTEI